MAHFLVIAALSLTERYKSSWDGVTMTRKLGEKLEKQMKNQDLSKFSFVFDAIDKLMMARRVLQWTFALAYYMRAGGPRSLFEYQQDLLSGSTEALQDIMDHNMDLEKLLSLRKDIINKTSSIDKFRIEMVNQVERGDFEDLLLSQADAVIDKWACSNWSADCTQRHRQAERLRLLLYVWKCVRADALLFICCCPCLSANPRTLRS
jgi:hypothetical protein